MADSVAGECMAVTFEDEGGLGLNFTPQLWPAIESIQEGSQAAATELRVGMCLIEVQGEDMVGKSMEQAGQAFQAAGRPLRLTFQAPVPSRSDEAKVLADEAAAQTAAAAAAAASAVSASASSWMSSLSKKAEEARIAAEEMYAKNLQERELRAAQAEAEAEAERRAQEAEAAAVASTVAIKTSDGIVHVDSPQKADGQEEEDSKSAEMATAAAEPEPERPAGTDPYSGDEEGEPPQAAAAEAAAGDDGHTGDTTGVVSEPRADSSGADLQLAGLVAEVANLRQQLAEQKASKEAAVAEKQSRIDALLAAATSAAADEQKAKAQLEESWKEESGALEKSRGLEQQLELQASALADKTEEATALSSELETTRQTLEDARADMEKTKAETKEKKSSMTRQGKMITKQDKQIDGLTTKLEEKTEEAAKLSRELEAAQEALELEKGQHLATQTAMDAVQEQVRQLEAKQAELEEQLESKTGEHLAVTADISGMLQINKIHQESLREHCKHIDDLRTKLTEAKISTLLKGDDAQHLDAEDVYQKSCTKLKSLRSEIKRQRKKLESEPEDRRSSVALGQTPLLLLQLMDDTVDMRERLNNYEWDKQEDAHRREQALRLAHGHTGGAGGQGQQGGAKRTHLSSSAVSELKQQTLVGYLHKRGEHNTSWKRRYFELKNASVKYFAQPGDTQEKGSIIVTHVDVRDAPADREHPHVFHLRSQDRIFILAAESADEKQEWMDKIARCRQIIVSDASGSSGGGM